MIIRKIVLLNIFVISTIFGQDKIDIINLKNGDVIKGEIIENVINDYIRVELLGGSILTYNYTEIESISKEKSPSKTFGSGKKTAQPNESPSTAAIMRDCYSDGNKGGQSVDTGGPMVGGLLGGFLGGFIGWGIVYAVVSGNSPEPNTLDLEGLDGNCRRDYRDGYKEGAIKAKKSSVNIGGALGTLIAVSILLNASTSTY